MTNNDVATIFDRMILAAVGISNNELPHLSFPICRATPTSLRPCERTMMSANVVCLLFGTHYVYGFRTRPMFVYFIVWFEAWQSWKKYASFHWFDSKRGGLRWCLTTAKQYCLDLVTISQFGTIQSISIVRFLQTMDILTKPIKNLSWLHNTKQKVKSIIHSRIPFRSGCLRTEYMKRNEDARSKNAMGTKFKIRFSDAFDINYRSIICHFSKSKR